MYYNGPNNWYPTYKYNKFWHFKVFQFSKCPIYYSLWIGKSLWCTLCWGWAIVRIFEPLLYLSLIISNISILLIGSVLWYQTSLKNQISATVPSVTLSKFSFPWETLSLSLTFAHSGILCLKLGLFHKLEGDISQITYKHGPDKNNI